MLPGVVWPSVSDPRCCYFWNVLRPQPTKPPNSGDEGADDWTSAAEAAVVEDRKDRRLPRNGGQLGRTQNLPPWSCCHRHLALGDATSRPAGTAPLDTVPGWLADFEEPAPFHLLHQTFLLPPNLHISICNN